MLSPGTGVGGVRAPCGRRARWSPIGPRASTWHGGHPSGPTHSPGSMVGVRAPCPRLARWSAHRAPCSHPARCTMVVSHDPGRAAPTPIRGGGPNREGSPTPASGRRLVHTPGGPTTEGRRGGRIPPGRRPGARESGQTRPGRSGVVAGRSGVVDSRPRQFPGWATLPVGAPAPSRVGAARPGVRAGTTTVPGGYMGPEPPGSPCRARAWGPNAPGHRTRRLHGAQGRATAPGDRMGPEPPPPPSQAGAWAPTSPTRARSVYRWPGPDQVVPGRTMPVS